MKVLMVGHACSPRQGSEPSGTWNWAWHLSKRHEVLVLAYPHDRDGVEAFLAEHPNRNLSFFWVTLHGWQCSSSGDRPLQSASLYLLWQALAYRRARELHRKAGFDLVHHVSYGSVSAPPLVGRLRVPVIWGPIGGGQRAPVEFRRYFGWAWSREILRDKWIDGLRFSPFTKHAARASVVALATNHETAQLLQKLGAADVRLCLDSGIPSHVVSSGRSSRSQGEPFTLLWVGRMQPRKALPLALEALAQVRDVNVKLLIAGDGEMRGAWENRARRLRVENRVEFLGSVPWDELSNLYQRADAFLFTSLRDSFGMQNLEAMAHGLPVLTLDHQGAAAFVPDLAGIKVPVTDPGETVTRLVEGIRWLAQNPEARRKLGEAGRKFAATQTWERKAEWMSQLYQEAVRERVSFRLGMPASYGSYGVKKRMRRIDETIDLRGMRILDLGCGNGSYTAELAGRAAYVCGVDRQMSHLKAFREPMPRIQAAGENLPFVSESFDAITMIEVLEHTDSERQVLRECYRVLKPGGFLVLFVPNKLYPFESHPCHLADRSLGPNIPLVSWLPDSVRKRLCHARIYSRRRLLSLACEAGFSNSQTSYIFPPLDSLRLPLKDIYRQAASWLEKSALACLGVSIYAMLQKKPTRPTKVLRLVDGSSRTEHPSFETLGVRVDAAPIDKVVAQMEQWIQEGSHGHSIAATGMHGMVEAQHDSDFKRILNATDLVVPDGMPLVWLARRRGYRLRQRVYGPDLMLAFCNEAERKYRHFFYGGESGVAERLAESLHRRFPEMQIAGIYSPPFRPLTVNEDDEIIAQISSASPDVLWVGLGTPKQERWMFEHARRIKVPVMVSVGAAFDLLSGRRKQAPRWLRDHGLEWLFRLVQEPRRLWRRYLLGGPQFFAYLALESLHRNFTGGRRPTVASQPGSSIVPRRDGAR
jgi:exopolysaccharide biosynthesis WecB/TagA/CpsF family protein